MHSKLVQPLIRFQRARSQLGIDSLFGPRLILAILVLVSLAVQLRFVLDSDYRFLATNWIQDNSFYYLQPAWLFKDTGRFTFDGEASTYGFQPLWMLLLAGLASTRDLLSGIDKVSFLRLALVLQSILYGATGIVLYQLGRRWRWNYLALVAPMLWLINPGLIEVYTTGKENTLYAFLLVLAMVLTYDCLHSARFPWTSLSLGIVLGLLLLARVNSLIAVLLFMATIFFLSKQSWRRRSVQVGVQISGIVLAALPWFLYAHSAFGTIMPSSGTRKLIGAQAALLQYLHAKVPQVPLQWLETLVSARERVFLDRPAQLSLPSVSALVDYTLQYLPHISGSFWLDNLLLRLPNTGADLLRAIFSVTLILVVGAAIWSRRTHQGNTSAFDTLSKYSPYFALIAFAFVNSVLNGFLFPAYLNYATWYAVPETLSIVIGVPVLIHALAGGRVVVGHRTVALTVFMCLVLSPGFLLFSRMTPRSLEDIRARFLPSAWETINWMNRNLPAGDRVGSWSSGLLGYFSQGPIIINLDGLANSPEFVDEVVYYDVLDQQGLGNQPPSERVLYQYLQSHQIGWLADADFEANLGTGPFFRTIPTQDYEVVWLGSQAIDWHEPEGPRRWAVIKLSLNSPQ